MHLLHAPPPPISVKSYTLQVLSGVIDFQKVQLKSATANTVKGKQEDNKTAHLGS
jgi:hypothetical protein